MGHAAQVPCAAVPEQPEITPESLRARIDGSFPADMGVEPLELTDER